MALVTKTLTTPVTGGFTIPLSTPGSKIGFSSVTIRASVVTWVKIIPFTFDTTALVTPTDPTPTAGATTDFYKMGAGEVRVFGYEGPRGGEPNGNYIDRFQYVQGYTATTGDLTVLAH